MVYKGKKLLVLGGEALSCEIVNKARSLGVYTIVTDWYPESQSPAKQIADKAFMVSTSDVAAVVELIKDENIDGVLTGFRDSVLPHYQQICEKAGLPCYATAEQIDITTNKRRFKSLCHEFSVPVVEEYIVAGSFDPAKLKGIKYPVIIKPVDNSGARGISICQNQQDLIEAYTKAMSFSQSKSVIIERYMTGKEVTIFYVIQDGEISLTAMGTRHMKHNQAGVIPLPVAYSFPSQYLEKYQEALNNRVIDMFKSIGIQNGMIFIQSLIEDGECVFYEMGYRLTGSLEYKILDKISGIDPLEMMIRHALTGKMSNKKISDLANPNFEKWGCNITFLAKPGKVGKISGIDEVLSYPEVVGLLPSYSEGDIIPQSTLGTLQQVIIRVFAVVETKEELAVVMDRIHKAIDVKSADGEDMLLAKFDTEELFDE